MAVFPHCRDVLLVLFFCLLGVKLSLLFNDLDPESARVASSKITTTLGLVVHAAGGTHTGFRTSDMKPRFHPVGKVSVQLCVLSPADGVALGAAASTSQTSVQLIVFVAIMLHKVG